VSDDRDWQHPAEHAAANNHGFIMNPPPLAKRLVALTAAVSLLASCAILFVAVPEGIDEYVDTPESTTTVPIVKGSVRSQLDTLTVGSVTSCAIEVLPRVWIAATDRLRNETVGTVSGLGTPTQSVRLFRSQVIPYLLVAAEKREDIPTTTDFGKLKVSLSRLSQASVVDCMNQEEMTVRQTPTQFADSAETPVYVSGDIRGMGIVLDANKSFIGIVGEHDHSQWFFQPRDLSRLINTAR
jgi:hypothetical protein